jgi:hypothetical protein
LNCTAELPLHALIKCTRHCACAIPRYAWPVTGDKVPPAPKGCGPSGRKLWRSVMGEYELDGHDELLLLQAVRCVDLLDDLDDAAADAPLTVANRFGELVTNPLLTEQRQQAIVYARLVAALRLPSDEEDARRPQRRSVRGAYGVRGLVS